MSDLQQKFNALLKVNEQLLEANKELATAKKYADLAAQAEAQELNRANQRIEELLAKQLTPSIKARREMFRFPKDTTAALIESTELVMKLQAENAALKEKVNAAEQAEAEMALLLGKTVCERDKLKEQLISVQKDVERYRWLRDSDHWPAVFSDHDSPEPLRGSNLNEVIDAAMAKENQS